MAAVTPPLYIQAASHPASTFRQGTQLLLGSPFGSFAGGVQPTTGGGGHGVAGPSDLVVAQNGTPNMSVNVAGGACAIRGTENSLQGCYLATNDATANLSIAAADPTNPRRDLVTVRVRDAAYSGAANDVTLAVITGTPAASPADPAVTANTLVLARVAVAALAASIVNANITDLRPRAASLGGKIICTSTTRPTGSALYAGVDIYETDTLRELVYDGTGWTIMSEPTQTWVATWANTTLGNGTVVSTYHRQDGWCDFNSIFTLGSTSAVAAGGHSINLPVNSIGRNRGLVKFGFEDTGNFYWEGSGFLDVAVANFYLDDISTYVRANTFSNTAPFVFGTGDSTFVSGRYQMATRYS